MGFFHLHRTASSSSSRSASSAVSSATNYSTPRTSNDLADDYMNATLKPRFVAPRAPLLDLPFEILQLIASYLDDKSAATFSLSNRSICYAIGTNRLSTYIASSPSRFDARERLEQTVERALPGAWHCAWCDVFHAWSPTDGPTTEKRSKRTCTDYNSYLSDSTGYTLRYHHLRLALAHHNHGPAHGIPLSTLTHHSTSTLTLFQTPMQTSISHVPKIANSSLLLHSSFSLLLPSWAATHKNLIGHLWPLLPAALTQHRASAYGHTGLMAAVDNVVRRGWRVLGAQSCADCRTDWTVSAFRIPRCAAGEFVRLDVRVWRDLGRGASPFEVGWRAHGLWIAGTEEGCARGGARVKGGVRDCFEAVDGVDGVNTVNAVGGVDGVNGLPGPDGIHAQPSLADEWEKLAYSWQLDKQRDQERDQEAEWRAIWQYIERRAGALSVGGTAC